MFTLSWTLLRSLSSMNNYLSKMRFPPHASFKYTKERPKIFPKKNLIHQKIKMNSGKSKVRMDLKNWMCSSGKLTSRNYLMSVIWVKLIASAKSNLTSFWYSQTCQNLNISLSENWLSIRFLRTCQGKTSQRILSINSLKSSQKLMPQRRMFPQFLR